MDDKGEDIDVADLEKITDEELKDLYEMQCQVLDDAMLAWKYLTERYEDACGTNREQAEAYQDAMMKVNEEICLHYVRKSIIEKIM